MWLNHLLVYTLLLVAVVSQEDYRESRLVYIEQGPVRGYKNVQENYYYFYNIPYATVKERFQVAVPPPTWKEPFDAVNRGIVCPQYDIASKNTSTEVIREDCLVVNLFVPVTNNTNLPVLVYVHGGIFYKGHGNSHRFTRFSVLNNVIVVTFNFRIGLHGFLCLGTVNIPGNAGMKDQVIALKWVKRNIRSFGGNPDEITIVGCSTGGAAVDLLLISKTTKGLFKRAIADSGSNLGAYAVQADPIENAKKQAKLLNFTVVDNLVAMEEFFLQ